MTNYREILRLHSLGLNKTEIAASLHCARNTVAVTLQRAGNCGLQWPLPDEMSDKQLADLLFPSAPGKPVYKMPDYWFKFRNKEPKNKGGNDLDDYDFGQDDDEEEETEIDDADLMAEVEENDEENN